MLALETSKLTRCYGNFTAVNDLDIRVEHGTFYGFLGPNGAGKSTTIKMLTGLLAPTSGSVSVLGRNPLDPKDAIEIKRRIGVVPENLALFDNLTAREYLTFIGRMHEIPKATARDRIDELLNVMTLDSHESKLTTDYSHGMRKKLALAAALLPDPDLLFLDEPFEGVDAVASKVIRQMLESYVARGSTVFLTSHIMEIVERICTHIAVIAKGTLVQQTSIEQLKKGDSLEDCFHRIIGNDSDQSKGLSWLEEKVA